MQSLWCIKRHKKSVDQPNLTGRQHQQQASKQQMPFSTCCNFHMQNAHKAGRDSASEVLPPPPSLPPPPPLPRLLPLPSANMPKQLPAKDAAQLALAKTFKQAEASREFQLHTDNQAAVPASQQTNTAAASAHQLTQQLESLSLRPQQRQGSCLC